MNGIFVVDKPKGITSHDVVLFFRRKFSVKKVGHAGTLDPMATGVLVLLLGSATRLFSQFMSDDKEYEGALRLGIRTDTHDSYGRILSNMEVSNITDKDIKEAFNLFSGTIEQTPPMVSAVRYNGKRLYQLARRSIAVKPKPRKITIYSIKIKDINLPEVSFSVHCSKGTYIRKLACDIGERLACGAHLTALRRIRSGRFSIKDAVSFEDLKSLDIKRLESYIRY